MTNSETDQESWAVLVDARLFDAVVFDMDGVLTDTASVHALAWQRLFDRFLADRAVRDGDSSWLEFERGADYRRYVDGRQRIDGVRSFLASRGIELVPGDPSDPPEQETLWGLANQKDAYFLEALEERGARAFPSSVRLIRALRSAGIRTAVVSASSNADLILGMAGLVELLEVQVDGVEAQRLTLTGKPDPALFLEAASRLGVEPERVVVIEDATAGVAAGRAGGFGLVVGVDRGGAAEDLRASGADVVVVDLVEIGVIQARSCCTAGVDGKKSPWVVVFDGVEPDHEGRRESLCTLGNGYMATRGAAPESSADGVHYPGTYMAGIYNRLVTTIVGRELEHEDLVNVPNWLPLTFRVDDGDFFGVGSWELVSERYELDLRHGILTRWFRARDHAGRICAVTQRSLVSMADPHLAAIETTLVAENWSGRLIVQSSLDGRVTNAGVHEYRSLADRHLTPISADTVGEETVVLHVETAQSRIRIAQAARTRARHNGGTEAARMVRRSAGWVAHQLNLDVRSGDEVVVEKVVAIHTSRDHAISECCTAATTRVAHAGNFADLAADHRVAWERLWARSSLRLAVEGRTQLVVNLHLFHLLQSLSPHTIPLDAGVTARGLHGEAYRGHVFWDELFILPFFDYRFPGLSRAMLDYRWRRLGEARWAALLAGHAGAMFPWQSGSDGREETPVQLFNVRSERWMPDNSRRQRHVSLAIAYNVWQHYQVTGELEYLHQHGAELLVEISRFWASIATHDAARDRYDISGVMGPDEFHDGYPDTPGSGLRNNTYTNVMASWTLWRTRQVIDLLAAHHGGDLWDRLELDAVELAHWDDVSRKLEVVFDAEGRLAQFDGYEQLEEFDWEGYRSRYDNIGRLDLILEAEGDTTNRYKVSKQADVLMLFYLLSAEELTAVMERLDYHFDPSTIPETVRYYLARTTHGSTLCRVAHAWVLARTDRGRSWQLFLEALAGDIDDTQGGTTREGIHLAAMAGTIDLLERCYTGLDARDDTLHLNPLLPAELPRLAFEIGYREQRIALDITHESVTLRLRPCAAPPVRVAVRDQEIMLAEGSCITIPLRKR